MIPDVGTPKCAMNDMTEEQSDARSRSLAVLSSGNLEILHIRLEALAMAWFCKV